MTPEAQQLVGAFRHRRISDAERVQLRRKFTGASPFPHLVLEDFVEGKPEEILPLFPSVDWSGWHRYQDDYQRAKMICQDIERMPEQMSSMMHELSAPSFLDFLADITGIRELFPDPFLEGGGLHFSGPGGVLAPHTDFHIYPRLDIYRRVNVLVYLNRDWEESYGGCLELYADPERPPERTVVPRWGTCVIFRTDDRSVHGFSQPIAEGRWRRSLAAYYYTSHETGEFSGDRNTYWRQHASFRGRQRVQLEAYRALLVGSRALAVLAHRVNPSTRAGAKPS